MKKLTIVLAIFLSPFIVQADELYKVKKGDTLWDICDKYYNNPFLWPKLWQLNPQVTNPHWIYPGDVLRLKESPETLIKATAKKKAAKKIVPKIPEKVIEAAGYLLPQKELYSGKILEAVAEDKIILGKGDSIFVSFKKGIVPSIGSKWAIFRISEPIKHPVTHEKVGYIHTILGIAKIIKVYKKVAKAKIIKSYEVIYQGDYLKPYQKPKAVSLDKTRPNFQACIVAAKSGREEIGWPDIVYIDAGKRQGVKPGQILNVFRKRKDLPLLPVGKIAVLFTTPTTATALVLKSNYAFHPGDIVR
jgi:hypothetical protein